MKPVSALLGVAFAVSLVAACSGADGVVIGAAPTTPTEDGGTTPGADGSTPEQSGPHALGTIVLGESHVSGESTAHAIVSASFVPDAAKANACKTTLEGCEIAAIPKCAKACGTEEICTLDASCAASCQPTTACTTGCETFDAGPLAFSGTTTAITLYPPYAFSSDGKGAPFLAGSSLRVQAAGAAAAGFSAFDETFTGTSFLQTSPALGTIKRASVFGTEPLAVSWVPGKDAVVVTVSGAGGTATCKADDAAGTFPVPRSVITRVFAGDSTFDTTLRISVSRQRNETKKGKQAKGSYRGVAAQSVAWVDLVTTSVESASFEGCSGGSSVCGDACVDLKSDKKNCGTCGNLCGATQTCTAGKCVAAGCVLGPENTLAACSDGCSNDGDIYIDCDDFDCCPVRSDCPATSSCGKK